MPRLGAVELTIRSIGAPRADVAASAQSSPLNLAAMADSLVQSTASANMPAQHQALPRYCPSGSISVCSVWEHRRSLGPKESASGCATFFVLKNIVLRSAVIP